MSKPSLLWRSIVRVERYLPSKPFVLAPDDGRGRHKLTLGQRIAFASVMIMPAVTTALRLNGRDFTGGWSVWRPIVLDLMLVIAGAALLAAVIAGAVAWRKGADA